MPRPIVPAPFAPAPFASSPFASSPGRLPNRRVRLRRAGSLLAVSMLVNMMGGENGFADIRLPRLISSSMVLQRDCDVLIWGWASPGEGVTLNADWLPEPRQTNANEAGQWSVKIPTGRAGGPHRLVIAGNTRHTLEDILFGEVWVGSGQSNMEMPIRAVSNAYTGIQDAAQELSAAHFPRIRLFQAGNFSSDRPLEDVQPGIQMYGVPPAACQWRACQPETVGTFAATAYFFARELHQQLDVPIGIIDASWGGTPAEAWTPIAGLKELKFNEAVRQAEEAPQDPSAKIPSRLYQGMIHPLRQFRIRGFIWYQGEGNAGRADQYRALFSTMIQKWRLAFGDPELPFYFVQLAPYRYGNLNSANLREAQRQTLAVPNTGMAVTLDIGDLDDIHPKNKQEVGRRLGRLALAGTYERTMTGSGPLPVKAGVDQENAWIEFAHADGLMARDEKPLTGFELAADDGQFFDARVLRVEGNRVVIRSVEVRQPAMIRFAYRNESHSDLINRAGLPAGTFSWSLSDGDESAGDDSGLRK